MTATVPDVARTLLDTIQPPCDVCDEHGDACGAPAAWVVTFVYRLDGHTHGPILFCLAHYGALERHRQNCRLCRALYDVQAEELR
jgi:hypothetical protein